MRWGWILPSPPCLIGRARLAALAAVLRGELALLARQARAERTPARVVDLAVLKRVLAVDLLEAPWRRAAVNAVLCLVEGQPLAAQGFALARTRPPETVVFVVRAARFVVSRVRRGHGKQHGEAEDGGSQNHDDALLARI